MFDPTAGDPVIDPRWRPDVPYGDRPWTIHEGNNRCALDLYDAETFDACVTDCPYGLSTELDPPNLESVARWLDIVTGEDPLPICELIDAWRRTGENPRVTGKGFMGNEWDALVPAPNTWKAVWRALKPGAYCMTFAGCRTHDLVTLSLRLAGFRIEDQVAWLQGQGMAKRRRLDLAIDTHLGMKDQRPVLGRSNRAVRPDGPARVGGIGGEGRSFAEPPGMGAWEHGPATPEATRHVGWDRGLHPRWEPVVVGTKPMRGKVAETALAYGTGGMHVDACRISRGDAGEFKGGGGGRNSNRIYGDNFGGGPVNIHTSGGYPTNVCIDEAVAADLDAANGKRTSGKPSDDRGTGGIWSKGNGVPCGPQYGDTVGPSAYFYVPKASTSERDAGLDDLDVLSGGERSKRKVGSVGITAYAGAQGEARNPHPTVKSVELMRRLVRENLYRYIARLASPPGAWHPDVRMRPLVLDPFCGSGSTAVAALREGVRVVGCEMMPQYADVARRRCQHAYAMPRETQDGEAAAPRVSSTTGQASLF